MTLFYDPNNPLLLFHMISKCILKLKSKIPKQKFHVARVRSWICQLVSLPFSHITDVLGYCCFVFIACVMCEVFSSLSVLCSVNVCVHPSFHPCPLWRFTQSSLLQVPSSHGAPPPQFAHHRDPPPSHRHTQRQAGVLSQWHRIPQQLVSSLSDFLLMNQVGMRTLTSPPHIRRKHQDAKKEEEKKKQPHIKKPLNAFMLYMKEMRAKVVAECTLKESAAINQILGRRVSLTHIRKGQSVMRSGSRLSQLLRPQIAVLSVVEKHCLFTFLFLYNCNLAQCCYWVKVQHYGKGKF